MIPVVAFFNNKGGVGKTTLVYHLAWMFSQMGKRVLAADIDPQANLTGAFLEDDRLEDIWGVEGERKTVFSALQPLLRGVGDIGEPFVEEVEEKIGLLPGDLDLSGFEDELAAQWTGCLDRKERSFRVVSALSRLIQAAGRRFQADLALMDLGPNLGAINRAALIAADWVAVPLAPDLYSVMGLKNLGPALIKWRREWAERLDKKPKEELELPAGSMRPVGYIILQHSEYSNKPVKAYQKWIGRIPNAYQEYILEARPDPAVKVTGDPNALSLIKHYRSLMAQAHEARKPVFMLRSADGVIGAHHQNVAAAYNDFKELARIIANRIGLDWNG